MSHDPEEGVRVSAPAATLFGLSALLLSISMDRARQNTGLPIAGEM